MKKLMTVAAMALIAALPALASQEVSATKTTAPAASGQWTGYITDTHCAEKGANKAHTAECVEKCMKGGAKAQIMNEADNTLYTLDGFDQVKALMGDKVTVKGQLDAATKTITVESASKAGQ